MIAVKIQLLYLLAMMILVFRTDRIGRIFLKIRIRSEKPDGSKFRSGFVSKRSGSGSGSDIVTRLTQYDWLALVIAQEKIC